MRTLNLNELQAVVGGTGTCTAEDAGSGNNIGGVTDPGGLGDDLIDIYEGVVEAVSHVIERIANSF